MADVVILGSGCAGWTAAIYAARAHLKPVVLGGAEAGGQLSLTTEVENFPGFPEGVQGPDLVESMKKQALKFGAMYKAETATAVRKISDGYEIMTESGGIGTKTVIIATGASARMLEIGSDRKYLGRGVSTCAVCDAYFYQDKEVVIVGGGDSACEESLFLTKFVKKLTIVHRRDRLRASKIMQERVLKHEKISFAWDAVVEEILGNGTQVTGVKLKNVKTGRVTEKKVDGIFVAIGHIPNTKPFAGLLELDEKGYVKSDRFMRTSLPGVFVAGDVTDMRYRQAVTAAGMGCMAAMEAERYLERGGA